MKLIFIALISSASALYGKSSPVIQLSAQNFDAKVKGSSKVTVVEFFAPWCGHCKNLAPTYEKVAAGLKGMVNVVAVDCDNDSNKALCGEYKVQGFPTIKMMVPEKNAKGANSIKVQDYQGERTVGAISEHAVKLMPSRVRKLKAGEIKNYLKQENTTAKALLFTKKGAVSSTLKALSTSFQDVSFAQIRDENKEAVKLFGISSFPQLLVLPGGEAEAISYEGELKFEPMRSFLTAFAEASSDSEAEETASRQAEEAAKKKAAADAAFLHFDKLETAEDLTSKCLTGEHKKPCVLLSAPRLANLDFKVKQREFRFAEFSKEATSALSKLSIPSDKVLFVNGKKGWYIAGDGVDSKEALQDWVDRIKAGELANAKQKYTLAKEEAKEEL